MDLPAEIFAISAHTKCGSISRTFGWFPTEELARHAALTNSGGLDEALYDWLCLETIHCGIHGEGKVVQWYRWSHPAGEEGRWLESTDAPPWATNTANFAMG